MKPAQLSGEQVKDATDLEETSKTRPAIADRALPYELRLFRALPFPGWMTALGLLALTLASLWATMTVFEAPLLDANGQANTTTRIGVVLCLIFAAAVTLGYYGQRHVQSERVALRRAFAESLADEDLPSEHLSLGQRRGILVAMLIGILIGIAQNLLLVGITPTSGAFTEKLLDYWQSPGVWFFVMSPILFCLLARALYVGRSEVAHLKACIRDHLRVDPLASERYHVFGRLALQGALSWIVFVAIGVFAIAIGPEVVSVVETMMVTIVIALMMAAWEFTSRTNLVYERLRDARIEALEDVREKVRDAQALLEHGQTGASEHLQGWLAYEGRLQRAQISPVSTPITARFVVYILIPVLPWLAGQALDFVLERLA